MKPTVELTDEELADEPRLDPHWCLENVDEYYWKVGLKNSLREIERLREFVQFVADHSNDPVVVRLAYEHGAKQ